MAAKRLPLVRTFGSIAVVLNNGAVAVEGEVASIETTDGLARATTSDATFAPIGYFSEDLTGDGVKLVRIELFKEIRAHGFTNDGTNPVATAHIFSPVYAVNGSTVSSSSAGNTRAVIGKVVAIIGGIVYVAPTQF